MIEAICRRLRALDVVECSQPRSGVVIGIDRDPMAKVTLLLFDGRGDISAVAKVARDPRAEEALRTEHEALGRLAAAPLRTLRHQVPAPLLLERISGRLVLASTALAGAPLTVSYYTPGHVVDRRRVAQDFRAAGDWIASLHAETALTTISMAEAYERHIGPVIERYRRRLGCDEGEARVFADLEHDARQLSELALPTPLVHGDYAIGNILVRGGEVAGVVDWEQSRACGLPLLDVLKFAASYSSFLDRAEAPRGADLRGHPGWRDARQQWQAPSDWSNLTGFMYGFFGRGWYPDLVRRFVDGHAARLGLPVAVVPVLLRAFVIEQATVLDNMTYAHGYQALLRTMHETGLRPTAPTAGAR